MPLSRIQKIMIQVIHLIRLNILKKRNGLIQVVDSLALVVDEGAVEEAVVVFVAEAHKEGSLVPELNLVRELPPQRVTDWGRHWDGKDNHVDEEGVDEVVGALEAGRDLQRWLWLVETQITPKISSLINRQMAWSGMEMKACSCQGRMLGVLAVQKDQIMIMKMVRQPEMNMMIWWWMTMLRDILAGLMTCYRGPIIT